MTNLEFCMNTGRDSGKVTRVGREGYSPGKMKSPAVAWVTTGEIEFHLKDSESSALILR